MSKPQAIVEIGERYEIGCDETDVTPVTVEIDGYRFTCEAFTDCSQTAIQYAERLARGFNRG